MIPIHATACYYRSKASKNSTVVIYCDHNVFSIDISGKNLRILPPIVIQSRNTLVHLLADRNLLNENAFDMPIFPILKTLSIDVNMVRDVPMLLYNLRRSCPKLTSLSIIDNPGWSYLSCTKKKSENLSKQYRKAALYMLPHLHSIDARTTHKFARNSRRSYSISSVDSQSTVLT